MLDPKLLSLGEYEKLVEAKLGGKNFKIKSIEERSPEERAGYGAEHSIVKIKICSATDSQTLSFFAKAMFTQEQSKQFMEETGFFRKEIFFYSVLSKDLGDLFTRTKVHPEFYLSRPDIILLEDMTEKGFMPVASTKGLVDRRHLEEALRVLARFHAACIVKEERSGKKLKELYPEIMFESYLVDEGLMGVSLNAALRAARDILPHLPRYEHDPQLLNTVRNKFLGLKTTLMELVQPDKDTRNVICHGDAWISNFLFKYENSIPTQALLIDFQMLRYGSPTTDVLLFLYKTLMNSETRQQEVIQLQEFYYHCLTAELEDAELDICSILPKAEYERISKRSALMASIVVLIYCQICDVPSDYIDKVFSDQEMYEKYLVTSRSEEVRKLFLTDEHFRRTMTNAMDNLADLLCSE